MIPTAVVPSPEPSPASPAQVAREFRRLLRDGMELRSSGTTARRPERLLTLGYTPKYKLSLFDTTLFLTNIRQNPDIRFFVAYVVQRDERGRLLAWARIFYKDISLIWRSASHFVSSDNENWVGKGALQTTLEHGEWVESSWEETTDLPLELQPALETLCRIPKRVPHDVRALGLILRQGPDDRIEPYRDFSEPRERAQADPRNLVNGGRSIAWFGKGHEPESLRFARGFEPDFAKGILETGVMGSRLYAGKLERFRILSKNRRIQYMFFAGPHHAWIIPPQATTTELMSFGVRTIDVIAHADLCVPGYEYHFYEDGELISQIPDGFAGAPSPLDAYRADASAWIERLPVIREFRRKVLRKRR